MRKKTRLAAVAIALVGLLAVIAFAQEGPAQGMSPSAAVSDDGSLRYEIFEVKGNVRVSALGLDPTSQEGWRKAKPGELLKAGEQLYVPPIRATVKLIARPSNPPTVILIERGTLIGISELRIDNLAGEAKSRIKLAYGAVRAGVSEGQTRSNMEIESPVATLSKRGTDIFRFEYHNGRFLMSLSEQGRGLIQAIQMHSGEFGGLDRFRSRTMTPGQWVSQQMMRAIENAQLDRTVNITDAFGLKGYDQLFTLLNNNGIGFLLPSGGNLAGWLDAPTAEGRLGGPPDFDPDAGPAEGGLIPPTIQPNRPQSSGDFGIGQGNLPGFDRERAKHADLRDKLRQTSDTAYRARAMMRNSR